MSEDQSDNYVLIIDDDEEDVFAFKWAMKHSLAKVEVVHYDDGAEAVDFLLSSAGKASLPELVLVDINMPGVNGFETLAAIRSSDLTRHLPVLMFSTSDSPKEVQRSYMEGANAHLIKPNSIKELRELATSVAQFWLRYATLPSKFV